MKRHTVLLSKLFNGEVRSIGLHHVTNVRGLLNVVQHNTPRSLGWGYALAMDAEAARALGVFESATGDHVIDVAFDDVKMALRTSVEII